MPRPEKIAAHSLPGADSVPVVFFDGIAHAILSPATDRAWAERSAPLWADHLGVDALGILLFDPDALLLDPLVYVSAAGTLVWERSCASGTAAIGAYLAKKNASPVRLMLCQPGGTLGVDASPEGTLYLTGSVRCLKYGQI